MKVMIVAHGHPALSPGGGERAAYSLFQHLKRHGGVEATFVARADALDVGHDGWFGAFRGRQDEILWDTPPHNWFRQTSDSPDVLRLQLRALIERFQPDVVHFHHYVFFGLDALGFVKLETACRVVLTLHEYLLICNHNGQMVKTGSYRPCETASPAECHRCFPDVTPARFFARAHLLRELLKDADAIISPSRFLRDRHVAWGLPPDRISVIENLMPPGFRATPDDDRPAPNAGGRLRLGYFGALNRFKGAPVLLDALTHLPRAIAERVDVVLFGAKLDEQPLDFQAQIKARIGASPARITLFGAYAHESVGALMASVDWVVVPSAWWENSPLVIQEARAAGRPVLASNIGGMAEKVRDGLDGTHFLAGNAVDLAAKIEHIVTGAVRVRPAPIDVDAQNHAVLAAHLRLYGAAVPPESD